MHIYSSISIILVIERRTFALLESNMANAGAQSLAGGSAGNADENRSLATEERLLESGISSAFDCVIHQCSLPLLKVFTHFLLQLHDVHTQ